MSETGLVTQETLTADLKSIGIRPAYAERWHSTTILGSYLPTLRSWSAGEPEAIGADIHGIVDSDDRTLRIYSLSKEGGFTRRVEIVKSGKTQTKRIERLDNNTLRDAEVTGVNDIALRRGTLPLLRLMELGNPDSDQEFVISLPDLAHRIQKNFAELTVS